MSSLTLTDKGKQAASGIHAVGPGAKVLRFLGSNGPSSVDEIAEGMQMHPRTTRRLAKGLYRKGYIVRDA